MSECNDTLTRVRGPLVPILAAFDRDERLDIESTCRWVESLIARGIRLFWTTHGTTHFMCLSDAEVRELTRAVAAVTRGRATLVASTAYHWPAAECVAFIDQSAEWGVDAVKLQVDWRAWPPPADLLLRHYQWIAEHSRLPLFAYTFGAPAITPGMLREIVAMPQFVGLKNDSGDFYEQTMYLAVAREAPSPFAVMTGGTMESMLHAWPFGATAFATGVGTFAPEAPIKFFEHLEAGRLDLAAAIVRDIEQPLTAAFAALGRNWSCFHAALHLQGHFAAPTMRFPLRTLDDKQIESVAGALRTHGLLP